jgi:hypothetical protein
MKKNTLYILAAAALVGFYFWKKNKATTQTASSAPALLNNIQADQNNCIDCNSNPQPMPQLPALPFTLTDAQVGPGQQISPTPASVLDPAQLIKFNQQVKGSLSGVC